MITSQSDLPVEAPLEPGLPIVDCHHHLWDYSPFRPALDPPDALWKAQLLRCLRHGVDELLRDLASGHKVIATVHVECRNAYRTDGIEALRPVGETEFIVAAVRAIERDRGTSDCIAAGIVGHADLALGDAAKPVLEAHVEAAEGRFRGVRQVAAWDADPAVMHGGDAVRDLFRSVEFRSGFRHLAELDLSFDAWLLEPQLPDLIDLARAFPETKIVLDHLGTPLGSAGYASSQASRFPTWKANLSALAELPNVWVKLSGLGMDYCGLPSFMADPPASSRELADEWRPWIETAIALFGTSRCMFASNFPSDCGAGSYGVIWNAFKRIAAQCSPCEKADLFAGTASRFYRIEARLSSPRNCAEMEGERL